MIEDAAEVIGQKYKNKMCGNIGIAGCFSFYPTKVITTGEGGMLTTNNLQIHQKTIQLKKLLKLFL